MKPLRRPATTIGALSTLCLLFSSSGFGYTPFDTISESTHKQISWEDFKAPNRQGSRWESGWVARIVTTLRLTRYGVETLESQSGSWTASAPRVEAYAVMDKFLSSSASVAKSDKVLAHEQLHFDLAEAWALRLTNELRTLEGHGDSERTARLDLKSQIDRTRAQFWDELGQVQNQYDDESVHGTRKKGQKQWAQRITEWFAEADAALQPQ